MFKIFHTQLFLFLHPLNSSFLPQENHIHISSMKIKKKKNGKKKMPCSHDKSHFKEIPKVREEMIVQIVQYHHHPSLIRNTIF